jgi:microcin C transport system substrate-binding protein
MYKILPYFIMTCLALVGATESTVKTIKTKTLTVFNEKAKHDFPEKPFSYVNPDALKGGKLVLSTQGTFDGLNRFSIKGSYPTEMMPLLYNTLMYRAPDEPFTMYPLLAKDVEVAEDSSFIIFNLYENATFSDCSPVTAEDVKATIEYLRMHIPRYKNAYSSVESIECLTPQSVRINFKKLEDGTYDKERPIIMGLVPVLPKKELEKTNLAEPSLTPIMGSGPYEVANYELGRFIELKRRDQYWAKDLYKGFYNFDIIRVDYYKNSQAQFQAFQSGESDVFFETNPQNWEKGYDFAAVKSGKVKKVEYSHKNGVLARYFALNLRKEIFQDIHLRQALTLAFDADSVNRRIFQGKMHVPYSTFSNTFYAHEGKAEGRELEILSTYKDKIGARFDDLINHAFERPETKTVKDHRQHIEKASRILDDAGYKLKDGVRLSKTGIPLELTLMIKDEKLEKIGLSFQQNLKKLGIKLIIQRVDAVQYENKVLASDFEIIIHALSNSLSPGVEQVYYYSARTADEKGSSNYVGVKDEVLEALAKRIPVARSAEEHVASVKAMDRYLMQLYCFIPIMYDNLYRAAYWVEHFDVPPYNPSVGTNVLAFGWSKKIKND